MAQFIKLTTVNGNSVFLSVACITDFSRSKDGGTAVGVTSSDGFFRVKETPDEIVAILASAGVSVHGGAQK